MILTVLVLVMCVVWGGGSKEHRRWSSRHFLNSHYVLFGFFVWRATFAYGRQSIPGAFGDTNDICILQIIVGTCARVICESSKLDQDGGIT